MEFPSPPKDKPMGFWASPRPQMDNPSSVDGFTRPDDPFNSFSELMNFDTYAGWCTSPSAADQMFASFALSAGYAPYDYTNFTEQVKSGFLPPDSEERIGFPTPGNQFSLPVSSSDTNGNIHEIGNGSGNGIIYRPPVGQTLAEKMLKALSLFKDSSGAGILAQVWVPIMEGDKYILSTCEQPYLLDQVLAGYREVSRGFTFSAEVKPGSFLGLPGRVFSSKVPEWTSNVAHYSKGEYLRKDHALSHEVRGSIAVPVFEDDSYERSCCAVLELVTMKEKSDFSAEMDHVCRALETVNLKSVAAPRLYKQCLSKNQMAALSEITDVLRAVCHAHSLPVALTWIPCSYNEHLPDETTKVRARGQNRHFPSPEKPILCIQTDACYLNDPKLQGFITACSEHHLEENQGIAGKALQSNHPFFFPDVKEYHIGQYPLVQHARKYGLNAAVAIRLRSTFTGDDDYILEFFLPVGMKGSTEQQLLLNNLSGTMQRICRSLRTVSESELGGVGVGVGVGVGGGGFQIGVGESRVPMTVSIPADQVSVNGSESVDVRIGARPSDQIASGSRRKSEKKRSTAEKNVSLSVLQQYFSGSLKDAAKAIGVCPTTLKRICRQHGISRWPSRKINKVNRSLKKIQTVLDSVQGVEGGLKFDPQTGGLVPATTNPVNQKVKLEDESYTIVNKSTPATSIPITTSMRYDDMDTCDDMEKSNHSNQSTSSSMTESSTGSLMNGSSSSSPGYKNAKTERETETFGEDGNKITVKATYKEDTVRFKYDPMCGWFQLYEEVGKRFKIERGSFQLKYKDDEEEWVLLVCESDWTECLEILEFLGTRNVKFLVRDAVFGMGSSGASNCFLTGSC
ncbi:hypothetical protein LXL04_023275 [Taraxacum kok-saghyz]